MDQYSLVDLLCNESFNIPDIGAIRCPTLRDIRKITYKMFVFYTGILNSSTDDIIKQFKLDEILKGLDENERSKINAFHLLLIINRQILFDILNLFLIDQWKFYEEKLEFEVYRETDGDKEIIGHINAGNFDYFRGCVLYILGMKQSADVTPKYKNKLAQKLYERMQKSKNAKKKSNKDSVYTLDNMILKYCTHNKVGINILNVWDMTYYQFIKMFDEYSYGRTCDYHDQMAAHSFSYQKVSDYKPLDYMKKINQQ